MAKNRSLIITFILCLLVSCLSFGFTPKATAEKTESVIVKAIDTIAGYSSLIKITSAPFSEVEILIKKPDNTQLIIPAKSDQEGEANLDLYGYHTKKAGTYFISGKLKSEENFGTEQEFKVYADELSLERSQIKADKLLALSNGLDQINLIIILVDQYNNPLKSHNVKIISSRNEDKVLLQGAKETDAQGKITFTVSSTLPGMSIYSVFDTITNQALKDRVKIVYYKESTLKSIGGEANILMTDVSAQSLTIGPLRRFKIEELPPTVKVNESLNFKITALDEQDNLVTNYNGTIHFATTDSHANLPGDYTFQANDLGEHTFSLSLNFSTPGIQTLTISDLADPEIKGEVEIKVENETGSGSSPQNSPAKIILQKPQPGIYSDSNILIEGETTPGTTVKIFDQDKELTTVKSNSNNLFTYNSTNLSPGEHRIYAVALDEKNNISATSELITITIDTTAPQIDSIKLTPDGPVPPGTSVTLEIFSEPGLRQVAAVFNEEIYELSADIENTGRYFTMLKAPATPEDYPVDLILVDQLGNDISFKEKAVVTVNGESSLNSSSDSSPSKVTTVQAVPGDKRVTLSWAESQDDTGINHYRIYFGTDQSNLSQVANTFTNATTWYIPNLAPDTTYYFSVTAIDTDNNESPQGSEIIASSSLAMGGEEETVHPINSSEESLGGDSYEEDHLSNDDLPEKQPDSGPEPIIILLASVIFINLYFHFKKSFQQKPFFSAIEGEKKDIFRL